MLKKHCFSVFLFFAGALLFLMGDNLSAAVSPTLISQTDAAIDNLRKRNCSVTVSMNGQPLAGKEIQVIQLHNDFGFGGAIHIAGLNWDTTLYGDLFRSYFDWAVPENEMKWPYTDKAPDTVSYADADRLVDWCNAHGVKVRGHCLFWNEDIKWLPAWTYTLDATQFRAAMQNRITGAMTHFKGRVAHWDIINELIHYPQVTHGTPEVTMFDSITHDPNIFRWILKQARAVDPVAKFTVNEYAILEDLDATPSTFSIYKDKMNRLLTDSTSFDIVGLEGHFGGSIVQSKYAANLDSVTKAIPRPIWLTEVDYAVEEDIPDRMEELMRTVFAHPNVGGLMLWSWWSAKMWRSDMTSTLADGGLSETETGTRWKELRDKWKTRSIGTTDVNGQLSFRGFQGEYVGVYRLGDKTYASRFYLEPGTGAKTASLALKDTIVTDTVAVKEIKRSGGSASWMYLNGRGIRLNCQVMAGEQLYLSTYSVSGQLLSRAPVTNIRKITVAPSTATGCRLIKIGTDAKTLFIGLHMDIR